MRKNLVDVHLHGSLGKGVGRDHWRLGVKTVAEACRAIDMLTQRRLTKHLIKYHQVILILMNYIMTESQ